jgi:L-amino acid N-acyltransferase YncA
VSERPSVALRAAVPADIPAIAAIYAHHVMHGLASFEEEVPSQEELARRLAEVLGRGLPWLVATDRQGKIFGYAYATMHRARSAYRYTLEDSIYIAPDAMRSGIGRLLLGNLMAQCAAAGFRQMVAVIGDSANAASITLHERMGFRPVGVLAAVGFKHGRWVDSVLMQCELGAGATSLP